MLTRILATAIFSIALLQGTALAQDKNAGSGSSDAAMKQGAQTLPQKLKQKLTNQGFSDVQVMPGSYIISAKDKDGDPVTAIVGPHSMTVFTISSAADTTGSAGADDKSRK